MKSLELGMGVCFFKAAVSKNRVRAYWGFCEFINNMIPPLYVHYHTHKFVSVHASFFILTVQRNPKLLDTLL